MNNDAFNATLDRILKIASSSDSAETKRAALSVELLSTVLRADEMLGTRSQKIGVSFDAIRFSRTPDAVGLEFMNKDEVAYKFRYIGHARFDKGDTFIYGPLDGTIRFQVDS